MNKIFLSLLLLMLVPQEAQLSQVFLDDSRVTLDDVVSFTEHIVAVKDLDKRKEYYKHVFPIETHHTKSETTTYIETVSQFEVVDVIKSKTLKKGDKIWLWREPNYNEAALKAYHEQDLMFSPIVEYYSPKKEIKTKEYIVFLSNINKPKLKHTYNHYMDAKENLDMKDEILKTIKSPKESTPLIEVESD